jgi:hypothetical protein
MFRRIPTIESCQKKKRHVEALIFEKNPGERFSFVGGQNVLEKDKLLLNLVWAGKASLEAQLKDYEHPIVGLDKVIEYVDPESIAPRVYNCTLCNTYRSMQTIVSHMSSYRHRVRYIKSRFPGEARRYLASDGIYIEFSPELFHEAAERCEQLETVYGRGVIDSRREKAEIPKEKLDTPEEMESRLMSMETEEEQNEFLEKVSQEIEGVTLESQDDVRIAKQIINILNQAVIEAKARRRKQEDEEMVEQLD